MPAHAPGSGFERRAVTDRDRTANAESPTCPVPRVLVLTPQMSGADGISAVSRDVVAALRGAVGCGVGALDVWTLADAAPPAGFDTAGVGFRGARGSRVAFATYGLQERGVERGTVVLVLHAHLLPVALPLAWRGARIVPMLLGIEVWKRLTFLQRAALRGAWRVAAISQHTIDRFRAANPGLAALPVRICHPGPPDTRAGGSLPDNSNGPPERKAFALIVGRMSRAERYKGHDQLLECWSAVRIVHPTSSLVIVGGGDDEPRLREKARALGLDGHVRFEGVATGARLAELYRRAAFFVMPSRQEGFGLVYLEAMTAGLPCIAAPGAAEEIVEHGVSGLIVDPRQPGALASAIVRLFADPGSRAAMGRAARRRVEAFAGFPARLRTLLEIPEHAC